MLLWMLDFPDGFGIVDEEGRARYISNDGSNAFDLVAPRGSRLIEKIKKEGEVFGDSCRKKYVRNKC